MEKVASSKQAIVIGAGIAGLSAAQTLSRYFDRVTIIDRDKLSLDASPRKGVPQSRHPHLMLTRGRQSLDELFPGLKEQLFQVGAEELDYAHDIMFRSGNGWRPRFSSDLKTIACSRSLLESTICQRLKANPGLNWVEENEVMGVEVSSQGTRVKGVQVQNREGRRQMNFIPADLVVDCSGRTSEATGWLGKLGLPIPRVEVVDAFTGYATRIYRRTPGVDWKAVLMAPVPPEKSRGLLITPLEGDRWLVTLTGINGDYPPTREEDFLAFLLPRDIPEIIEVLAQAEPLSGIVGSRGGKNRLYHYEQLPGYLENFLLMGDSVFVLNPAFGQGMTLAFIGAKTLEQSLEVQKAVGFEKPGLTSHFQKALFETLYPVWESTTARDALWPNRHTEEYAPVQGAGLVANYMKELMKAAEKNNKVLEGFYRVGNLMEPSSYLLRPEIFLEVIAEMSGSR